MDEVPERIRKTEKFIHILSWVGSFAIIACTAITAYFFDVTVAANFLFWFITVMCFIFCGMYGFRSRWRETQPGRAVMYIMASFGIIGVVVSLSLLLGSNYPGRDFVRFIGYLAVALSIFNITLSLYRYQKESKIYLSILKANGDNN